MTRPHIPNIMPTNKISRNHSVLMLLSSVAREDLALANIVHAEAAKIQHLAGMLDTMNQEHYVSTLQEVWSGSALVQEIMHEVISHGMILHIKSKKVLEAAEQAKQD